MKQGEIWFVEFTGQGHEYQKTRPAVVIESDSQLKITSVITVVPVTKQQEKHKDDIFIAKDENNKLLYDSVVKVHQIQTFDKTRFIKKIGNVSEEIMEKVKVYLKRHFGI
ncbi:MAG: type II toxin-antitoxin system PemK/MazF family toxin [Candidatus Magasanikbacteria bacterium]|nr:type II toxin-antitoxin system PemK/MazF family toxin [Candidatus Magasanikbacteria bacterium]